MKQEAVTGFRVVHEPVQALHDVRFGGAVVDDDADVIDVKGEIFEEDIPDVGDVVDAQPFRSDPGMR